LYIGIIAIVAVLLVVLSKIRHARVGGGWCALAPKRKPGGRLMTLAFPRIAEYNRRSIEDELTGKAARAWVA
jgi:hypothetical protein